MAEPASPAMPGTSEPDQWRDLANLVRHIIDTHHGYVRRAIPALTEELRTLVNRYGTAHPELHAIRQTFSQLGDELLAHMEKEEHILFPYIRELAAAHNGTEPFPPSPFGTVANPVRMMEDDHQEALALLSKLRELAQGYTPADDWPAGDAAAYEELARFEADLHQHITLEDTVLFPRALDLEERLA